MGRNQGPTNKHECRRYDISVKPPVIRNQKYRRYDIWVKNINEAKKRALDTTSLLNHP
jgi:hypothetical protein